MDPLLKLAALLLAMIISIDTTTSALANLDKKIPPYLLKGQINRVSEAKSNGFYQKSEEIVLTAIQDMGLDDRNNLTSFLQRVENIDDTFCRNAILEVVKDFYFGKAYARQMYDAMGRRESGLRKGNYFWAGTYFECFDSTNGNDITGKMCQAVIGGKPNATILAGLTVGVCVPDVCTEFELISIAQSLLANNTPESIFVNVICTENEEFNAADITAFVIFGILVLLLISGTTYEVILMTQSKKKQTRNGKHQKEQRMLGKLFLSFSIINNTKILLNLEIKEGNLECLHGMRFISMAWVILGHTVSSFLGISDNIIDISEYFMSNGSLQGVSNATFSVDTFFFLSGLLVAYLGLREMDKRNGKINVPLMYLSRYLRLTPSMAAVMLFVVSFYGQIGYGPLFEEAMKEAIVPPCQKYWWNNLLYINNMYPSSLNDGCINWVWYLANDMQFYILSPIYLLLFYKYPKVGLGVVGFTIVGSAAITGALSNHFNIPADAMSFTNLFRFLLDLGSPDISVPDLEANDSFWNETYVRPWCRIGVYVIGMATGYVIHVTKRKIKMNEVFVTLMWMAVIAVELTIIYGFVGPIVHGYYPTNNMMYFYNAVSRPVWALGLSWVTIACVTGYGGLINSFLSWKFFIPLSRLTYCAYLVHVLIVLYMYSSREYEMHFAVNIIVYYYLAVLLLAYAFAYVLSMLVEAPTAGIVKLMLQNLKSRRQETNDMIEAEVVDKASAEKEKRGMENILVAENAPVVDRL